MANQTADREDNRQDGKLVLYPTAASTQFFKGGIVSLNTSGFAKKGGDTASEKFAGVVYEGLTSSSVAGAEKVKVWAQGVFEFAGAGFTQADVGKQVYIVDDQTVGLAATTTNDVLVGRIVEYVSATKVRVGITPLV